MNRTLGVVAAGLLVGATGLAHQAGGRASAEWPADLTRVNLMAEDALGKPVSGLSREDFEILSDGQSRPIEFFSSDASPLTVVVLVDVTASLHRAVLGVAGLPSTAPTRQGSTGAGMLEPIPPAVEEFPIAGLRPDDRVRVGAIGRRLVLSDRFTSDARERAKAWRTVFALPPIDWLGPSPIWDAVAEATTALAGEPGHVTIVLISDGEATGNVRSSRDVSDLAALAGVSVSVVAEQAILSQSPLTPMSTVDIDPTKALRAMADRTGGAFVLDEALPSHLGLGLYFRRDPRTCLRVVLDRLHHAYVLGFAPAAADGKRHTLEVRVKKPGVTVRARKAYGPGGAREKV